jgi:hypothetical protein
VSTDVNSVQNNDPSLTQPLADDRPAPEPPAQRPLL